MSKKKRTRRTPAPSKAGTRSASAADVAVLERPAPFDEDPAAEGDAATDAFTTSAIADAELPAASASNDADAGAAAASALADIDTETPRSVAADAMTKDSAVAGQPAAPVTIAGQLPSALPSWTMLESGDIRGVLIQVAGGRLLLPNATIAEVLSYAEPEPADVPADWLLGRFRWRGWQLPLIAFSQLAGIGRENPGLGSKVIVLKALGGDRRTPFFAVLTQGFPRLVSVARAALEVEHGGAGSGVLARVRLNDEPALLPDLSEIEERLKALREAA